MCMLLRLFSKVDMSYVAYRVLHSNARFGKQQEILHNASPDIVTAQLSPPTHTFSPQGSSLFPFPDSCYKEGRK